jgi:penicillin amidase
MQSMVVADADGHIGLIAPGRVPVRDPANKIAGRIPVPGWDATYDWKGYLKFEDLPRFIDPPAGATGTANARIVPPTYPYFLTYDWDAPFRQQRIGELILQRGDHDMASMRADGGGGAGRRQRRRRRAGSAHHLGFCDARRCRRAADLHGVAARVGACDLQR